MASIIIKGLGIYSLHLVYEFRYCVNDLKLAIQL